jgi:predicted ribosome quality control (RQC) complex YloA/Tae2 family protein
MDNVVLTRVAVALDHDLKQSVVSAVRSESASRYRFVLVRDDRPRVFVVSLDGRAPWIGRPVHRAPRGKIHRDPFAALCARRLQGSVLVSLEKPSSSDRRLEIRFADGQTLVVELSGPADLILLDPERNVVSRAGKGRSGRDRLAPGVRYTPRAMPAGRVDPFGSAAAAIDGAVGHPERPDEKTLRSALFGIGRETARLVVREAAGGGGTIGEVLERRLAGVRQGDLDPVVEAPADPVQAAERGDLDPDRCRLLPWDPGEPAPGWSRFDGPDPAATVGIYYDALELALDRRRRAEDLGKILSFEARRLRDVSRRIEEDVEKFRDAELWRRRGEALLAGLGSARRSGEVALVPDPYRPDAPPLAVPVRGGATLPQAAEACFNRHRRARRGIARAEQRRAQVAERFGKLERLAAAGGIVPGAEQIAKLEEELRKAGIPVALDVPTRGVPAVGRRRVRVEGVRVFRSSDGWTVLVGKSGKDNARLTFKLAGPEDFWFHAEGVSGAHVIVRNDERKAGLPQRTLEEAAAAAAWYSGARGHESVDVRWTRRKYVRKIRGSAPGTVRVKKCETLRVRPAVPPDLDGMG